MALNKTPLVEKDERRVVIVKEDVFQDGIESGRLHLLEAGLS